MKKIMVIQHGGVTRFDNVKSVILGCNEKCKLINMEKIEFLNVIWSN